MKVRLSKAGFDNACRFIRSQGRRLDAALLDSIDPRAFVWPSITERVDLAAHAPWWSYTDDLA